MKYCGRGVVCLLILLFLTSGVLAGADVDITGQVRVRPETTRKSFDADEDVTQDFTDLRTRVQVDATIKDNVHAVVQIQDSRRFGANDASGTLTNTDNVDIHQAYLSITELWTGGIGLRAGRFEVALGNQRVFGTVGWSNVGRSWEGFQLWFDDDHVRADGFWLKRLELYTPNENREYQRRHQETRS